jgi:hypothetical protein
MGLKLLKLFYEAAEEAFKDAKLDGNLHGLKIVEFGIYFVHSLPACPPKETL